MKKRENTKTVKLDTGTFEIRIGNTSGIAKKINGEWELSPNLRQFRNKVLKKLEENNNAT